MLLDGIPVYNPFHLGGLFGTFIDQAVGGVEMLVGGFPAEYGGAPLERARRADSASDARAGVHGTVGVSVLSSSATLGGTLSTRRAARGTSARGAPTSTRSSMC